MSETAQQYTQRILSNAQGQDPLKLQSATTKKLDRLIKGVTTAHYDKRDPRKSIELHRVVREANLALLKSLSPDQWKHFGQHAERGQESIEHIVRMVAGHDVNHIHQIERILKPTK